MRKKITILITLLLSALSFSQNNEERKKIIDFNRANNDGSVVFNNEKYSFTETKDAVLKAIDLGISTTIVDSRGNVGELVRFDGDLPIYYTVFNQGGAITTRANLLHPGGSMGLSLSGNGMIAGVWDQNHPRLTHNDFKNSGGVSRLLAVDGPTSPANHSTHVTGTILSSGANSLTGRGIAYDATGWIFDWTNDMAEMNQYAGFGLLVSNHSYGLIASNLPTWYFGAYVSDANAVDNICFNNQKYLPVYAAGNDRDDFATLNSTKNGNDLLNGDKTAKNPIIVGAVFEVNNYVNASSVSISSFSSYGPTDDFRIKPDIVAKGVNVNSTTFTSNTSYGMLSGTSMASPGVTASLLLVQQYNGSVNSGNYLNASTLKGLALHTADEAGPTDGPDHMFGWGLLNSAKMVQTLQNKGVESMVIEGQLTDGQVFTQNILALGSEPLKVSISWTDRPGNVATSNVVDEVNSRLVNDLDLVVTKQGVDYSPWKLNKDWNNIVALKGDNDVDPFERVDIVDPVGVYQIAISHKGTLVGGTQNYSLIVTGVDADAVLGINDFESSNNDFLIWKNQNGSIGYSFKGNIDLPSQFVIHDVNGRLIYKNILFEDSGEIEINDINKGVYFIEIQTSSGVKVRKKVIF
ncbi:S8 family serine peptidase [Flavobacterium sp. HNIBRBA15423]|uniref:S8 family serine peptidase n=1 Tax=Flavobacterium sp. HNIBRBA15423 TaxID=3458683 RepID=UPI0040446632